MSCRGFMINKSDGSYAGVYTHDDAINLAKFPEADFEFVPDDDDDPRVSDLRDQMSAQSQ